MFNKDPFEREVLSPSKFKAVVAEGDDGLSADEIFILFYRKKLPAKLLLAEQKGTVVSVEKKKQLIFNSLEADGFDSVLVYQQFERC